LTAATIARPADSRSQDQPKATTAYNAQNRQPMPRKAAIIDRVIPPPPAASAQATLPKTGLAATANSHTNAATPTPPLRQTQNLAASFIREPEPNSNTPSPTRCRDSRYPWGRDTGTSLTFN
jgi:hypothetical protein